MDAQNLQDQLFGFLKANPTQAYPAQTLADGLRLDDANAFTKVVQALAALERGGKVKVNEEGAFQYDAEKEGIIGVFKSNDKGFGFVHYDDKEEDVFINPDNTMFAVQGDEVRVKLLTKGDANTGRGPEGKVAEIITHAREHVVGEFTLGSEYKGYVGSIRLTDKKFASFEFLVKEGGVSATDGEVVVASIDQYPSSVAPKRFTGAITEKVGYKDDPGVDILQIVYNHDVPHVFPEAVLEQANKIPDDVQDFEREGREDITDQPLVTIDAIASLNPGVDRLAMSAEMEFTPAGDLVNHRLHTSVMRSHARMTYKAVNAILAGDEETRSEYSDLVPMFEEMEQLHNALAAKRTERGAIEFDAPEAKIIVDETGKPTDIELRERGLSERMIESFMLAANETVAMHFDQANVPFLYRIHESPDADRVQNFVDFVKALGAPVKIDPENIKSTDLQAIHNFFLDRPEEQMVSTMMLRTMKQAKYSDQPLGHFGIGAEYYTHFTSPIRRYPDLTVHRLIKWYEKNGLGEEAQAKYRDKLAQIGEDTSVRERRAVDTERDTDAMKKAEFMEDKVGDEFEAVVNGVLKFGMFVSLENTVEGLIHTSNFTDDQYVYDEAHMALIGRRFHHIYQIGQPVKVRLIRVDKEQSALDFVLVDPDAAPITDIKVPEDRRGAFGGRNRGERRSNDKNNRSSKGGKTQNGGKPFGAKSDRKPESKHQNTNRKGRH